MTSVNSRIIKYSLAVATQKSAIVVTNVNVKKEVLCHLENKVFNNRVEPSERDMFTCS
jgi:hypothetical protein